MHDRPRESARVPVPRATYPYHLPPTTYREQRTVPASPFFVRGTWHVARGTGTCASRDPVTCVNRRNRISFPWSGLRLLGWETRLVTKSNGRPRAIVLRAAGINCDVETTYALEKAGASAERVHVNRLVEKPEVLAPCHMLVRPGGFSYGDDIASAKVLANELRFALGDVLRRFVEQGGLVLGICNGFQVLVKSGLLGVDAAGHATATLSFNDSGRFEDRWVYLKACSSRCVFVKPGEDSYLPVAHGEGKFIPASRRMFDRDRTDAEIVMQYSDAQGGLAGYPDNPNGSYRNIAGLCNRKGNCFGIMPHPERFLVPYHHPTWTRNPPKEVFGLQIFKNAVEYARG